MKEIFSMDINSLVHLVFGIIVFGAIAWLLIWFTDYTGIPQPFNKVVKIIIFGVCILFLIGVLTGTVKVPMLFNFR